MPAPFTIETGYPAPTDVQSAFPSHETAFRSTVWEWLNVFSDPTDGSIKVGAFSTFLSTENTWTAAQNFSDVSASGDVSITGNATIGGTLDVTGATTLAALTAQAITAASLVATGAITAGAAITALTSFVSSNVSAVLATTGAGAVYLRPNGPASATGQATLGADGSFSISGNLTVSGGTIAGTATGNVPNGRAVGAGNGLTGGGALSADISLNVGAGTGISVGADTVSVDATVWRDGDMPTLAQLQSLGVAGVYTGSDPNNLTYPVGTKLSVGTNGATVARNAAAAIYLSGSDAFSLTASGTALTGTWRNRGRMGNDGGSGDHPIYMLFERVS